MTGNKALRVLHMTQAYNLQTQDKLAYVSKKGLDNLWKPSILYKENNV